MSKRRRQVWKEDEPWMTRNELVRDLGISSQEFIALQQGDKWDVPYYEDEDGRYWVRDDVAKWKVQHSWDELIKTRLDVERSAERIAKAWPALLLRIKAGEFDEEIAAMGRRKSKENKR